LTEVFPAGQIPTDLCNQHQGWSPELLAQAPSASTEEGAAGSLGEREERRAGGALQAEEGAVPREHPFRSWLRRVFGLGARRERQPPPEPQAEGRRDDRGGDPGDRRPPDRLPGDGSPPGDGFRPEPP
jgi:hypothetical protein